MMTGEIQGGLGGVDSRGVAKWGESVNTRLKKLVSMNEL